jgi:beta-lactamase class D
MNADRRPHPGLDRRRLLSGLAVLPLAASGFALSVDGARAAPGAPVFEPRLAKPFGDAGEVGVLAFEIGAGEIGVSDPERAKAAYLPASTFKIPNTIIALETGVVASLDDPVFKWDRKVRSIDGKQVEAWNRDQPLREAFRNSTVWVYQEIARRVGPERMAHFVKAFDFGNRTITGAAVDQFWLSGDLRMTALQQIAFLAKLRSGSLPVSARAQNLAKEAMEIERTDAYVLRGKTGWAFDQKIGWFVGWIETENASYLFALNLDVTGPRSIKARAGIVKAAARDLGYM